MSNFTAVNSNEPPAEPIINPWFCDIDINHMRDAMRIDKAITNERLRTNAMTAILEVNQALHLWQQQQIELGYDGIDEIQCGYLDDIPTCVYRYRMAVYHSATAKMLNEMQGYDSNRKTGSDRLETIEPNSAHHLRTSRSFVKRIQGKVPIDVDLI